MKRYQIIRTHQSPYQSKDFITLEAAMMGKFHGCCYEKIDDIKVLDTILITNTHTQLRLLPSSLLKQTKLIIHPNSGYDHFAHEQDFWRDIPLVVGHSIRAQAVAEYSLRAVFEGLVELPQHMTWHGERTWNRTLLKESKVWIFGYGHIGKIIADTLSTLGVDITIVDPFVAECPYRLLKNWKEGNLSEARVVIAAMSLNPTSEHLFNKDFFDHSSDIIFINGARGKLVDEKALKEYLLTHPEAFAFLDVFEKEPFGEEWHGFPQVWKTSHIAGVEKDLDQKILDFEEKVLADFLSLEEHLFYKKYEKELLQNKSIKGVIV